MRKHVLVVGLGLVALSVNAGCVKTTRIVTDKEGRVTEEVTSWEPSVVTVYSPPMIYGGPVVYDYTPSVLYRTYYPYSFGREYPRYFPRYRPVYTHAVHIGGHHYRHRHHR